jgi:oxygen-independent coproporphyrinogen-3 oxidase
MAAEVDNWRRGGFGLYVHWPFCAAKCPYCDFNSHVTPRIDADAWEAALVDQVDAAVRQMPGRTLGSIFFGGGTPSLMPPRIAAAVIDRALAGWDGGDGPEITLEANPTSVEATRLAAFRAAGVNRVSLGVQALDDTALRQLGRQHDAHEALEALEVATRLFDRVSLDLIYARQGQSLDDWTVELGRAVSLGTDHLSLYQLTIEPGTVFARRHARGRLPGLPDDGLAADLYEATQDICEAAGFEAYEVSNHARPGSAARHNLCYWRGGDWAAVGPGAHGRLTLGAERWATEAVRAPGAWLSSVQRGADPVSSRGRLTPAEVAEEYLLTSLRLAEGTDLVHLARSGHRIDARAMDALEGDGLIRRDRHRLTATPAGRLVLNSVLAALPLDPVREQLA